MLHYKRFLCWCLCVFCAYSSLNAQFLDTLHAAIKGNKSVDGRYEGRWSFIDHLPISFQSAKIGINFGKKLSIGGGYCWLNSRMIQKEWLRDPVSGEQVGVEKQLKMGYLCYYVDYIFYKDKRWTYSLPTQFGFGFASYKYLDAKFENQTSPARFLVLYEPSILVKFKIFTWLGLGANVGYRLVLKNSQYLPLRINSPLYSGGVLIYWDELALALFPKNKWLQEKIGPPEW